MENFIKDDNVEYIIKRGKKPFKVYLDDYKIKYDKDNMKICIEKKEKIDTNRYKFYKCDDMCFMYDKIDKILYELEIS